MQPGNANLLIGDLRHAIQEIGVPGLQIFPQSARRRHHPGKRAPRSWYRFGHPQNTIIGSDRFFPHLSIA